MNEEELKKKNVELKAEMQKMMDENKKKSEEIELKIKEKQKNSEVVQERLKTMMQTKLEALLTDSTKEKQRQIELMQKEQELKAQITMYDSNFDQLDDSIKKSGKVFSQLKKEIKKVPFFVLTSIENRDAEERRRTKERVNESQRRI